MKKNLIELHQRWDILYQRTMEHEKTMKAQLEPLEQFEVVCCEFEVWLEDIEEKEKRNDFGVASVDDIMKQKETCQVIWGRVRSTGISRGWLG